MLVDECVARPLVEELRREFEDVVYVADIRPAAHDSDVLAWAVDEGRVLVTEDYDFGDLVFRSKVAAYAIVIIAPGVLGVDLRTDARSLVRRILAASTELQGRLTIVERERLRQRPLIRGD